MPSRFIAHMKIHLWQYLHKEKKKNLDRLKSYTEANATV